MYKCINYFRTPATHTMPNWMKELFLRILPKVLMMRYWDSKLIALSVCRFFSVSIFISYGHTDNSYIHIKDTDRII